MTHQDNIIMEELINPAEFTEKELLKLVYRDLHKLRTEFEDYKKTNNVQSQFQELQLKVIHLENCIETEQALRDEGKKQIQRNMTMAIAIVGLTLTALSFVLKYIIK